MPPLGCHRDPALGNRAELGCTPLRAVPDTSSLTLRCLLLRTRDETSFFLPPQPHPPLPPCLLTTHWFPTRASVYVPNSKRELPPFLVRRSPPDRPDVQSCGRARPAVVRALGRRQLPALGLRRPSPRARRPAGGACGRPGSRLDRGEEGPCSRMQAAYPILTGWRALTLPISGLWEGL